MAARIENAKNAAVRPPAMAIRNRLAATTRGKVAPDHPLRITRSGSSLPDAEHRRLTGVIPAATANRQFDSAPDCPARDREGRPDLDRRLGAATKHPHDDGYD